MDPDTGCARRHDRAAAAEPRARQLPPQRACARRVPPRGRAPRRRPTASSLRRSSPCSWCRSPRAGRRSPSRSTSCGCGRSWRRRRTCPTVSRIATVTAQFLPEGRLGRQAVALRAVPDVPVTLALGPETLEAWSRGRSHRAARRRSSPRPRRHQALGNPYVPIDMPSLLDHGLSTPSTKSWSGATKCSPTRWVPRPDTRTRLVRPASAAALAAALGERDRPRHRRRRRRSPRRGHRDTGPRKPTADPRRYAPCAAPKPEDTVEALVTDAGFAEDPQRPTSPRRFGPSSCSGD